MGWLLGCFTCTGEFQQVKPKKQSSGVANLVSGRANSAAVAHATSPEDLHRVRKSSPHSAVANSNTLVERECLESSSSSLLSFQSQAKKDEDANLGSKLKEANEFNRERSFIERLVQEADAAKQLDDEVKDSRSCRRVLEPPPDSFDFALNKSEKDRSGQRDFAQHSWLVSSLITRNGLLFEACSRPSSPFPGLHEHGSLHSRGLQASQSIDFYNNLGSSNLLKCAEFNTFRVESGVSDEFVDGNYEGLQSTHRKVELKTEAAPAKHKIQSPPWTFSEAKLDSAGHNNSYIFESSDDLLREHLDVSSLIEDSALITNWELSSGELHSEKRNLHDQSPYAPSKEDSKVPHFLEQTTQKHRENRADGNSSDSDSSHSMVVVEVSSDDGTAIVVQPLVGKGHRSSNGVLNVGQAPRDASGDKEMIHAFSNIDYDAKAWLLQAECCTDIEGSDNESGSQSCFSSQFKRSKRQWRKNPFEREFSMAGYLHDNDDDVDDVLLPCTHPEMQLLEESKNSEDEYRPLLNASTENSESNTDIRVSYNNCSGVHGGSHHLSSTASSLEALIRQDSVEVLAFKDETVARREGDSNVVSSPIEEEIVEQRKKLRLGRSNSFAFNDEMVAKREGDSNVVSSLIEEEIVEQRKKLRLGHSSSFEKVQDSILVVEEEQVQLFKTVTSGDCHESSLDAREDIFNGLESSASEQLSDESTLNQTSDVSLSSPSMSYVGTPMVRYQSPASLADDRPILGTVAAHWSPITTKKWWDGKGIPNSTNKYKEDQKVNWHAVPFEVRLEQALAKQDSVHSK